MAKTEHYYTQFEPGRFYHVYNRTIDKKPMFFSRNNYEYFLRKFDTYLTPILDTYAYNLLGNHFHFLVRIKDPDMLSEFQILANMKHVLQPTRSSANNSGGFSNVMHCLSINNKTGPALYFRRLSKEHLLIMRYILQDLFIIFIPTHSITNWRKISANGHGVRTAG